MSEDRLAFIQERVGALDAKVSAAHARMDREEVILRQEVKGLRNEVKQLSSEVKDVIAFMNRGKGWSAALLLLSGFLGASLVKVLGVFSTRGGH